MALANAHLIGLQPMTVTPGTLFEKDNPTVMTVRIATVDTDIHAMNDAVKTLKGFVQKVIGINLGVKFATGLAELQKDHPAETRSNDKQTNFVQQLLSERATTTKNRDV